MPRNEYLSLLLCLSLAACGGGGGSPATSSSAPSTNSVPNVAKSVSGVAAYGAPLANADIVIKDANGKTATAKADLNGKWMVADVSGLTAPLIIQAKGSVGDVTQEFYSVLITTPTGPVTANVTPLTTALLNQAAGVAPATLFADPVKIAKVTSGNVEATKAKLLSVLSDYIDALGMDASKVDLISTSFEANNKGLDKLMDLVSIQVSAAGAGATIQLMDKSSAATVKFGLTDEVKKLPRPDLNLLALPLEKINTLKTQLNDARTRADFEQLVDTEFRNLGFKKGEYITQLLDEIAGGDIWQIKNYEVIGCFAEKKVCRVRSSLVKLDGKYRSIQIEDLKLGLDGAWRLFGDQQSFYATADSKTHRAIVVKSGLLTSTSDGDSINFASEHLGARCYQYYLKDKVGVEFKIAEKASSNLIENIPQTRLGIEGAKATELIEQFNSIVSAGGAKHVVRVFSDQSCTKPIAQTEFTYLPTQQVAYSKNMLGRSFPTIKDLTSLKQNHFLTDQNNLSYVSVSARSPNSIGGSCHWYSPKNDTFKYGEPLAQCGTQTWSDAGFIEIVLESAQMQQTVYKIVQN